MDGLTTPPISMLETDLGLVSVAFPPRHRHQDMPVRERLRAAVCPLSLCSLGTSEKVPAELMLSKIRFC